MEQNRMNIRKLKRNSTQPVACVEDMLLEMIHHEAFIKMQVEQLKQDIELALETGEKDLFIQATDQLRYFELILSS